MSDLLREILFLIRRMVNYHTMEEQKKLSVSKNALYNMVGSIFYCFCQWIISALIVVRLSPSEISASNRSLLQLAISITNIFYSISNYNMRTYQISDTKDKYSSGDYIGMRFVTAAISVILCAIYVIVLGYSAKNVVCVLAYMIYKLSETFSDVLHGIDQKKYRMDYVGISFVIRGIVSVATFTGALIIFGDVFVAIVAMAIATLAVVVIYDAPRTSRLDAIKPVFNKRTITTLLIVCLPTVISTACFTAITSVPRQMLEAMHKGALGYYGTIATPLVVVQVMATSIFNPTLTQLAEFYNDGKSKKLIRQMFKDFAIVGAIAAVTCVCIAFFGEFAIGLVFGKEYVSYTGLMYGIVACTSLYVVSWLAKNVLIIMRKLKICMVASLITLPVSILLSKPFIKLFYMNGVSYSVIVAYVIHITICLFVIFRTLKNKEKNCEV